MDRIARPHSERSVRQAQEDRDLIAARASNRHVHVSVPIEVIECQRPGLLPHVQGDGLPEGAVPDSEEEDSELLPMLVVIRSVKPSWLKSAVVTEVGFFPTAYEVKR